MNFIELVEKDLDKRYSDLLDGKTRNVIDGVKVDSDGLYEKYNFFKKRLIQENYVLNSGIESIKRKETKRIERETEEAEKAKKAAEEAEKVRKAAEEAEKAKKAAEEAKRIKEEARKAEKARKEAEAAKEKEKAAAIWANRKKKAKVVCISVGAGIMAIIITAIIAAAVAGSVKAKGKAASNFVFSVVSKENDYEDSSYYDGHVIGFHVSLNNKSPLTVSKLFGDMRISLNSPNYTWDYNISLSSYDGIKAKTTSYFVLTTDERKSDKTLALYNASMASLQIEYKLTKIIFDNFETQTYSEPYRVIKPYGSYGEDVNGEQQDQANEQKYQRAITLYNQGKYEEALSIFETISFYKDSSTRITSCKNAINEQRYQSAVSLMNSGNYDDAIATFESLADYKDSRTQIYECKYRKAKKLYDSKKLADAYSLFSEISSYKDSSKYIASIQKDADETAKQYALTGNYHQAIDLLKAVGKTKENSDLYAACNDAIRGDYRNLVSTLNPEKVVVCPNLKTLQSQAFYNCKNVVEIVLPDGLTTIGSYAFSGCVNLTKINMPDSITTIEEKAFRSCTCLTSFTVPSNLETLGGNILSGCSSLSTITTKFSNNYFIASFFLSTPKFISTKPSWPSSLTKIIITSGDAVPKNFFAYLPNTVTSVQFAKNVIEIGENAFDSCKAGFILPTTVKYIRDYAYSNMGKLGDSITLHNGLETIGACAFQATYFKSIYLPKSLTSIGRSAFVDGILKTIYFEGTKKQWLSIIDSEWAYGIGQSYTVDCSDAVYQRSIIGGESGWTDK